jgi:hypothetical protein
MLYKVYAQNCVCAKRISKATEDDLNHVIDRVYDRASEAGLINDMTEDGEEIDFDKMEKYYDQIRAYFDKNKNISAGDYMIVDVESMDDITIPNACYGDESFIF